MKVYQSNIYLMNDWHLDYSYAVDYSLTKLFCHHPTSPVFLLSFKNTLVTNFVDQFKQQHILYQICDCDEICDQIWEICDSIDKKVALTTIGADDWPRDGDVTGMCIAWHVVCVGVVRFVVQYEVGPTLIYLLVRFTVWNRDITLYTQGRR